MRSCIVGSALLLPAPAVHAQPPDDFAAAAFASAAFTSSICAAHPVALVDHAFLPAPAKSVAILGGMPSALEATLRQQASLRVANSPEVATLAASVYSGPLRATFSRSTLSSGCPAVSRQAAATIVPPPMEPRDVLRIGGAQLVRMPFTEPRPSVAPAVDAALTNSDVFLQAPRIRIGKTRLDAKWDRVADRALDDAVVRKTVGATSGVSADELLAQVNLRVNKAISYREDRSGRDRVDVWSDAPTTLRTRKGDCEDIAILKYHILAALGIPHEDMFLTIARDTVRRNDHALLVVRSGGRFKVLDSATDVLLDGSQAHDYMPIVSFNSEGRWLHGQSQTPSFDPVTLAHLSRSDVSSARLIGFRR